MTYLDLTLPTPAENLACDEALLDRCETEGGAEILRCWEPRDYFVVVGYANKVSAEARVAACAEGKIPILRRCSGGGTVLQGPGCLNYSLILRIEADGPLRSIASANRFIMERNRDAIETLLSAQSAIAVRGHTDLVVTDRKCSGNAQRRRKHFLLFHGTFLLRFDLSLIEQFLPVPARQPVYRQSRAHRDFLINLELPADSVKQALREAWSATEPVETLPHETIPRLARDKYVTPEWNLKL